MEDLKKETQHQADEWTQEQEGKIMHYKIMDGDIDDIGFFEYSDIKEAKKDYDRYVKQFAECIEATHLKLIEIDGENERILEEFIKIEDTEQQKQEKKERAEAETKKRFDEVIAKQRAKIREKQERAEAQAQTSKKSKSNKTAPR